MGSCLKVKKLSFTDEILFSVISNISKIHINYMMHRKEPKK